MSRLARQQYLKNNVNKGRNTFDRARRHAVTDRTDFTRGLDYLQGLQGVLELTFGDQEMGSRLVNAARECTHSLVALQFFLHGISRLYKHSQGKTFWAELLKSQPQVVSARVRKEVFLMFEHLRSLKEDLDWSAESTFVRNCLAPLGSTAFSREEAIYYVPRFGPHPEFHSLGEAMIAEGLRRDPNDPRFRMYSELEDLRSPLDLDLAKVESIYRDATRQGDKETAGIAKTLMQLAENFGRATFRGGRGFWNSQRSNRGNAAAWLQRCQTPNSRRSAKTVVSSSPCRYLILSWVGKGRNLHADSPSEQARKAQRKSDQPDLFSE